MFSFSSIFSTKFLKITLKLICVCVYCVSVPLCLRGVRRSTLWTQLSLGNQTQKVRLHDKLLSVLSQPSAPPLPNLQSAVKLDNFPHFFLRMIFRSWRQLFLAGWWQLLTYVESSYNFYVPLVLQSWGLKPSTHMC